MFCKNMMTSPSMLSPMKLTLKIRFRHESANCFVAFASRRWPIAGLGSDFTSRCDQAGQTINGKPAWRCRAGGYALDAGQRGAKTGPKTPITPMLGRRRSEQNA